MISKERLLAGLNELVYVEEGMVTLLANFSKVITEEALDVTPETKEKIKKLLTKLYQDSTRHKTMMDRVVLKIEGSGRNEF